MKIEIISVGKRMPDWVDEGFKSYIKRMPHEIEISLTEIALPKRTKSASIDNLIEQEGKEMLAAIPKGGRIIALDERGKGWSSQALADELQRWRESGETPCLLIGGPDGLTPACLEKAERRWSLSPLTLPHPLVRILLAEQLYRAWSILAHHPYHRV